MTTPAHRIGSAFRRFASPMLTAWIIVCAIACPVAASDCAIRLEPHLATIPGFQVVSVVHADEGTIAILAQGERHRVYLGIAMGIEGTDVRIFRELADSEGRVLRIAPDVAHAIGRIATEIRREATACTAGNTPSGTSEEALRGAVAAERKRVHEELEAKADSAKGSGQESFWATLQDMFYNRTSWPLSGDPLFFPIVFWGVPITIAIRAWRRQRSR